MPTEHFVMTVQSIWDGEAKAAATASGLIETDGMTREEVYDQAKHEARQNLANTYPNRSIGELAVIHWSCEVNEP